MVSVLGLGGTENVTYHTPFSTLVCSSRFSWGAPLPRLPRPHYYLLSTYNLTDGSSLGAKVCTA